MTHNSRAIHVRTRVRTHPGTLFPNAPRWWMLRTTTVKAVDIASRMMVVAKYVPEMPKKNFLEN